MGWLSLNSSTKITVLATSEHSTSRSVRASSFVAHGGSQSRAAMNLSRIALRPTAVRYTVSWQPFTTIWSYPDPVGWCFLCLLLPVLRMIFKCAFWVIFLVAALVESWCIKWCLRCCWVPMSDVLDKAPVDRLNSDPLLPGWGISGTMIWWCRIGKEDDYEKKWEVLRNL